ncbi:MAG: hypothetical protein V3U65_10450, partial [Granulosicoccaceae bacterium]
MRVQVKTLLLGTLIGCCTALLANTTAPGDVVVENLTIASSLTGQAGDAAEGRKIFANRKQGNCLAC